MRTQLLTIALVTAFGCAAAGPTETPNELGLSLTTFDDGRLEGTLVTSAGAVDFTAIEVEEGLFDIEMVREGRTFGSVVNWTDYEVDLQANEDFQITQDDRFVITALASTIEEEVGKDSAVADNLFRQATLWGSHPTGELITRHIEADPERGWTTLCYAACTSGYRNFYHSGSGNDHGHTHGSHSWTMREYIKFGRYDSHNPCNSRCGPGCTGWYSSAWTQDCGNHDRCEHAHTGGCSGEWWSASDDFSFAGNCRC